MKTTSRRRSSSIRKLLLCLVLLSVLAALTYAALLYGYSPSSKSEVYSKTLERIEPPPLSSVATSFPLPEETPSTPNGVETEQSKPKNVILFVADGLGFAHLTAARAVSSGIDGPAVWDRFNVVGWQRSHPANGLLTDSAASATALSTGVPTSNGAVGVDPQGEPLVTLFERAAAAGRRLGLVTDSYIWDATPAAFASHVQDRDEAERILRQLAGSDLDLLFGELEDVGEEEVPTWDESEAILSQRFKIVGPSPPALSELTSIPHDLPLAAIFEEDQITNLGSNPTLPLLTEAAVQRLRSTEVPYMLVIESEECDSASHNNDLGRVLRGLEAIDATLTFLLDHIEAAGDTLLIFTSDHETGGLSITATIDNRVLRALWGTDGHTAAPVPVMASGPGADAFGGIQTNWSIGRALAATLD